MAEYINTDGSPTAHDALDGPGTTSGAPAHKDNLATHCLWDGNSDGQCNYLRTVHDLTRGFSGVILRSCLEVFHA